MSLLSTTSQLCHPLWHTSPCPFQVQFPWSRRASAWWHLHLHPGVQAVGEWIRAILTDFIGCHNSLPNEAEKSHGAKTFFCRNKLFSKHSGVRTSFLGRGLGPPLLSMHDCSSTQAQKQLLLFATHWSEWTPGIPFGDIVTKQQKIDKVHKEKWRVLSPPACLPSPSLLYLLLLFLLSNHKKDCNQHAKSAIIKF